MKTEDPLFTLEFDLPTHQSRSVARTLHGQLKSAIRSGRLAPGLRLPATRALAEHLGISRNSVIAAYDLLTLEGDVWTRTGSGHYVCETLPPATPDEAAASAHHRGGRLNADYRGFAEAVKMIDPAGSSFDFRLGVPEIAALPLDVWGRLSNRALRLLPRREAGYASPAGEPALRAAIAAHVSRTRAVACSANDVVVTAGAQQAFDLIARVLVTPGRTVVAVEDPGYPPLRDVFAVAGAVIAPVPVDDEGLRVDLLPPDTQVICVTPSHQFPLGVAMSAQRRRQLLTVARQRGAVIVEDDYDGEFRFDNRPLDALQTLSDDESVLYVGTFSKSLFPGLRMGFIIAPEWARHALIVARQRADWHGNLQAQNTLASFITEGHLTRHVRRMRAVYGERRRRLAEGLGEHLGHWLAPIPASAGLHVGTRAIVDFDVHRVVAGARERGVNVDWVGRYAAGPGHQEGLLFGYGAIDAEAIPEALQRLRAAFEAA
jgi:GntR family transcriptional regulator/MocR family aminotransferase